MTVLHPGGPAAALVDVREELLRGVPARRVSAAIVADEAGVVAGAAAARREAERLGLSLMRMLAEGSRIGAGEEIARLAGSPRQIVMAEETLIGLLAKPSGIATAASRFAARAAGRPRIVSGAWKKMPAALKEMLRAAVTAGGADPRMVPGPFVYLDKTWTRLLGGIGPGLAAVAHLADHVKVVQVKGRHAAVAAEAREAAERGADIVFVDTGRLPDIAAVTECLARERLRQRVRLAFGGGVRLEDVEALRDLGVDILDIGRHIVDAPLLDMRLEILEAGPGG